MMMNWFANNQNVSLELSIIEILEVYKFSQNFALNHTVKNTWRPRQLLPNQFSQLLFCCLLFASFSFILAQCQNIFIIVKIFSLCQDNIITISLGQYHHNQSLLTFHTYMYLQCIYFCCIHLQKDKIYRNIFTPLFLTLNKPYISQPSSKSCNTCNIYHYFFVLFLNHINHKSSPIV